MTKRVLILLFLLLLGFVAYTFFSTGYFKKINEYFNGEILSEGNLPGTEDITVSQIDSFAIISSTKRNLRKNAKDHKGGLYHLELKSGEYNIKHLTKSFPNDFAPHGISMIKTDSNTYKILAINHANGQHTIEVFSLQDENLRHLETISHESLISPNDLVLIDEDQFYFTNDHKYTDGFGKVFEEYSGLPLSAVIYFDGQKFRQVANGIAYSNGINFDHSRNLIYVASARKFLVKVYQRNEDGSLDFIEDIKCGTGVDNIELDEEMKLWIGAHPSLLHFSAYADGKSEFAPSEVISIDYKSKGLYDVNSIYMEKGEKMSASTVAAPFGDKLIVGNYKDDKFLILQQGKSE